MAQSDDLKLLEAWRAGDSRSGEQLFERHFASVSRFFRNKVSGQVEDLVQQTFLACVETQERFRGESAFRTYLLGIANNVLRNHYRRHRRKEGRLDFGTMSVHDVGPGASTLLGDKREQQLLVEGLRRIPLDAQVVLELYYWEAMSASELGAVLGIPEGTVRGRIRRAKQLLEAELGKLADSPHLLESTIGDLEGWAKSLRERPMPGSGGADGSDDGDTP